jgi:hypothetical protein
VDHHESVSGMDDGSAENIPRMSERLINRSPRNIYFGETLSYQDLRGKIASGLFRGADKACSASATLEIESAGMTASAFLLAGIDAVL